MRHYESDFLVIGGGVAGLSVAASLAARGKVVLLEQEAKLAYHATGRSVTMYSAHSGNTVARALTRASRAFFDSPPWPTRPLLTRRGMLVLATDLQQYRTLEHQLLEGQAEGTPWSRLTGLEASGLIPIISPSAVLAALYDHEARQIEVGDLTRGYEYALQSFGGQIAPASQVQRATRTNGRWCVSGKGFSASADVVINASGAWADIVAATAGLPSIQIQARRRTVAVASAPPAVPASGPMTTDAWRTFYFRPAEGETGVELFMSPCDETPVDACDTSPEAADVMDVLARYNSHCVPSARLTERDVRRSWAGLRTFVPDELPVIGFDPLEENFFWLAGQGGHGLQAAPAMSQIAAALICGDSDPEGVVGERIDLGAMRVRRATTPFGKTHQQ
jgi:D-arginine dehydrogenase